MNNTKIATSKSEFLDLIDMAGSPVPSEIIDGLRSGSLKLVDSIVYATRKANAGTVEIMQASDNKVEGVTNLNNRKLEATNYFLLKKIRLLSASITPAGTEATPAELAGGAFGIVADVIANSELDILVAGKTAFPRNSCQIFKTTQNTRLVGEYELDCARLIAPQSEIVPMLHINSGATVTDTYVRIELIGSMVVSA